MRKTTRARRGACGEETFDRSPTPRAPQTHVWSHTPGVLKVPYMALPIVHWPSADALRCVQRYSGRAVKVPLQPLRVVCCYYSVDAMGGLGERDPSADSSPSCRSAASRSLRHSAAAAAVAWRSGESSASSASGLGALRASPVASHSCFIASAAPSRSAGSVAVRPRMRGLTWSESEAKTCAG